MAADARKNAAAIAAAKEQLLKDQLEEAKGQLREATQERQAAQALAAKVRLSRGFRSNQITNLLTRPAG